ncbi:MAG: sporulation protein YqfC [Defluviitaleaceae bacterium]|nr:sporulation protein YqfC [Defluviitaleaceae bacterium]
MKEKNKEKNLKKNIAAMFELPKDIMLNLPYVSIIGNEEILLQNHKGLIEYSKNVVRIKTTIGIFTANGEDLYISKMTNEYINILGKIKNCGY